LECPFLAKVTLFPRLNKLEAGNLTHAYSFFPIPLSTPKIVLVAFPKPTLLGFFLLGTGDNGLKRLSSLDCETKVSFGWPRLPHPTLMEVCFFHASKFLNELYTLPFSPCVEIEEEMGQNAFPIV
jgi:hypothetical protein